MTEKITKTSIQDLEAVINLQTARIEQFRALEVKNGRLHPRLFREITVLRELLETYKKVKETSPPSDTTPVPISGINTSRIAALFLLLQQRKAPTKAKAQDAVIHDGNGTPEPSS